MKGIEAALIGRLARDGEFRMVRGGGLAMLTLSVVADDPPMKIDHHEKQTTWVRIVCFGDLASDMKDRLHKGDQIYAEGRMSLDRWKTADGGERSGLSMVASRLDEQAKIGKRRKHSRPATRRPPTLQKHGDQLPDDDLPF